MSVLLHDCETFIMCCVSTQIREETNTKIDLPTENSNSEMIVITGKKSNCEAARDRILAIQNELVRETECWRFSVFLCIFFSLILLIDLPRPTWRRQRFPYQPSCITLWLDRRGVWCALWWKSAVVSTSTFLQRAQGWTRSPSEVLQMKWREPKDSCFSWPRRRWNEGPPSRL